MRSARLGALTLLAASSLLAGCPAGQDQAPGPVTPATASVGTGEPSGERTIAGLTKEQALAGRSRSMDVPALHQVLGTRLAPPFPDGLEKAVFAMGCFWGAEKGFWGLPGVHSTAVGYAGGFTPNPTYEEVCTHRTGHAEAVLVVFDPKKTTYAALLKAFWEGHDPTQGMRQGNDAGSQYRSAIYTFSDEQQKLAEASRAAYGAKLRQSGFGLITTEILPASDFFYAEDYHQQYLAKNPNGYCPDHGTGVTCPAGLDLR